jgi:rifampin ADP-ribosylating transferase
MGVLAPWEGHAPDVLQAMKDNVARARESGTEAIDD